jgi:hypothetical protein
MPAPYNVVAWQSNDPTLDFRLPDTLQRMSQRRVPWSLVAGTL